jgi:hypothetical protein
MLELEFAALALELGLPPRELGLLLPDRLFKHVPVPLRLRHWHWLWHWL